MAADIPSGTPCKKYKRRRRKMFQLCFESITTSISSNLGEDGKDRENLIE